MNTIEYIRIDIKRFEVIQPLNSKIDILNGKFRYFQYRFGI